MSEGGVYMSVRGDTGDSEGCGGVGFRPARRLMALLVNDIIARAIMG